MGLLIDSTLLIHAERHGLTPERLVAEIVDRLGDVELAISAMSAGELFHGCWRAGTPARRARREEFVETLLSALPVVDIQLPVMRIFGEIDARLRAGGKRLPTSDLLIACTALSRGDKIVTGNARHFRRVPGLTVHEWT
ncbi:MAG: PIN domain-containing protein [Planctomycetes bacterium]|nr:PIN domain-containing protein [Planctomycetota bacterium]